MKKNNVAAFFLGFIPGFGHLYLNKMKRGFAYAIIALGSLLSMFALSVVVGEPDPAVVGVAIAFFTFIISMIDLIVTFSTEKPQTDTVTQTVIDKETPSDHSMGLTIVLSFIPGLGHMHLGLMNRGLTFMLGFFGISMMIIFVSILTDQGSFLIFMGALPVVWMYSLFDLIQLIQRKRKGETIDDRTILEDLEEHRERGHKSKTIATFLSIFPGAGHMYLGLQRRGLQLMAAFLFSIYILDVLRLSLFLFLIPILWFYSFFDALQQVSKYGRDEVQDVPIVEWLINHQRWVGYGLLALGIFYVFDRVAMPIVVDLLPDGAKFRYVFDQYLQTTVVSLALIFGGAKLLSGSKKKGGVKK